MSVRSKKQVKAKKKKRPGMMVRFYPTDLARLSKVCADQCTPRENYVRRTVLAQVTRDETGGAK